MLYSLERLQLAKSLFLRRKNGPPRPVEDGSSFTKGNYTLRSRHRMIPSKLSSTWIDNDDDETYHPCKEKMANKRKRCGKRSPPAKKRAKTASSGVESGSSGGQHVDTSSTATIPANKITPIESSEEILGQVVFDLTGQGVPGTSHPEDIQIDTEVAYQELTIAPGVVGV